jgi:hypothetical protein
MIILPPRDGIQNGGGGVVLEVLLALSAIGAATLAVLAMTRPPPEEIKKDEPRDADE